VGDVWVGVIWACILIFVWLRGKIRVREWCCEVVESCEVQLSCEVRYSTSSQPDKNLYVCMCVLQGGGGGAACQNAACSFGCTPTQTGPVCECPDGFQRIGQGSVAQLLAVCLCVRFSGF